MGWLGSWLRKKPKRSLLDPDFGPLVETEPGSWHGDGFALWGYEAIQILINADSAGPTSAQRDLVARLRADADGIRGRIEAAVRHITAEVSTSRGALRLSTIYLPRTPEQTWRVWYDVEGEEHYWFGAEIQDRTRIVPFVED